ncbi:hypothetical protein INR49_023503 [Caranx melampygus]|nr:hypothetical protein INR49_023503 [Caranx melampygus]
MSAKTVTRAIKDVLQDLSVRKFEEFCDAILDRRDEPKVRIADLEGKSRVEVANTLVSIYTEAVARDVVLQALGEIRCNAQRESFAKDTGEGLLTCNSKIMKAETTGASMQTAKQSNLVFTAKDTGEGLLTCVRASHTMAETDQGRMGQYKSKINKVGSETGIDPALIAGIISRESRAGNALIDGWGDGGRAWGLMQVDITSTGGRHQAKGDWDSEEHIRQGTGILVSFIGKICKKFPNWSRELQLKGGIAAYNMGDGNFVSTQVDERTTGGDYANDVVARAQWYKKMGPAVRLLVLLLLLLNMETSGKLRPAELQRQQRGGTICLTQETAFTSFHRGPGLNEWRHLGVRASEAMARNDSGPMKKYKCKICTVAGEKEIHPALIAAIISRESRAGELIKNTGGGGDWNPKKNKYNAFGLMQVVDEDNCGQKPQGGIAAYNMGDQAVKSDDPDDVDENTTHEDYSNDVVARAQWFIKNGYDD